jgi:hypothetical protein
MLKTSKKGVITLDATWGPLTHTILKMAGQSNTLVINEKKPENPRVFTFMIDAETWTADIMEDLRNGRNVVVVSLSSERVYALEKAAKEIMDETMILTHTSKTCDAIKKELKDVDALWEKFQLVLYSPTIAAGVDFSNKHFHKMYFYACSMSVLPSTALQMLFRVRHLDDVVVKCCTAHNMRLSLDNIGPKEFLAPRDMMTWLRWMSMNLSQWDPMISSEVRVSSLTLDENDNTYMLLPAHTYWLEVLSYVEAEKWNSNISFVKVFADMAERAGHRVVIERIVKVMPAIKAGSTTTEMMLSVETDMNPLEFEEIKDRIYANTVSGGGKWPRSHN